MGCGLWAMWRCWGVSVRCWMLGVGFWVLDVGYWVLGVNYYFLPDYLFRCQEGMIFYLTMYV